MAPDGSDIHSELLEFEPTRTQREVALDAAMELARRRAEPVTSVVLEDARAFAAFLRGDDVAQPGGDR